MIRGFWLTNSKTTLKQYKMLLKHAYSTWRILRSSPQLMRGRLGHRQSSLIDKESIHLAVADFINIYHLCGNSIARCYKHTTPQVSVCGCSNSVARCYKHTTPQVSVCGCVRGVDVCQHYYSWTVWGIIMKFLQEQDMIKCMIESLYKFKNGCIQMYCNNGKWWLNNFDALVLLQVSCCC